MNEAEFWKLFEDTKPHTNDDCDIYADLLVSQLKAMPEQDIINYACIFQQKMAQSYQSKLWAAFYIANGGCSDDCFEYCRCWLIGCGQKIYEAGLLDPDSLVEPMKAATRTYYGIENEPLMYVAFRAYQAKTGKDDLYDLLSENCPGTGYPDIEFDWEDTEESLSALLPQMSKAFRANPIFRILRFISRYWNRRFQPRNHIRP